SKIGTAVLLASGTFVNETTYALAFENNPMANKRRVMTILMAATQAYSDVSRSPKCHKLATRWFTFGQ
ncbi:hypothetical protein OAG78_01455, partial [bacterium]|nr:hypothetical protein [bacterium]